MPQPCKGERKFVTDSSALAGENDRVPENTGRFQRPEKRNNSRRGRISERSFHTSYFRPEERDRSCRKAEAHATTSATAQPIRKNQPIPIRKEYTSSLLA